MDKAQKQVREFHRDVLDQPISPAQPKLRNPELRARLILEEAIETVVALVGSQKAADLLVDAGHKSALLAVTHSGFEVNTDPWDVSEPDLVEVIDGLCDTIVVCYGTAESIGIDLEPFMDEVMRTNMAKVGGPVNEHGKRLKPPGWQPPNIAGILARLSLTDARVKL
jgi:predicted HAD superfamily Cof-like phosphohydrolase